MVIINRAEQKMLLRLLKEFFKLHEEQPWKAKNWHSKVVIWWGREQSEENFKVKLQMQLHLSDLKAKGNDEHVYN